MANRLISFKHFFGSNAKWANNISSNKWANDVVFGKIWNEDHWEYKIYAGQALVPDEGEDTSINYIYDIPSKEQLESIDASIIKLQESVNEINDLINIDADSSRFTNSSFIYAIEQIVNDSLVGVDASIKELTNLVLGISETIDILDASIKDLDASVRDHEDRLTWINKEE